MLRYFMFIVMALVAGSLGGLLGHDAAGAIAKAVSDQIEPASVRAGNGAMWTDVDGITPTIWNLSDRLFVGGAADKISDRRSEKTKTWLHESPAGPEWIPRDSQLMSIATHGTIAIAGATRTSDAARLNRAAAIGLAGYALSDRDKTPAWGAYLECQLESGNGRQCYGAEIDVKNKGNNSVGTPFGVGVGGHALWLAAGGDNSYGGPSSNPSTSAITVVKNSNTWNSGIIFAKDAITGCDGTGSTCQAVKFAIGQQTCWFSTSRSGCIMGSLAGANAIVFTMPSSYTPSSSSQKCSPGAMSWDDSYVYICTAANTWKRANLSAF